MNLCPAYPTDVVLALSLEDGQGFGMGATGSWKAGRKPAEDAAQHVAPSGRTQVIA
jgi:hypothetical protein